MEQHLHDTEKRRTITVAKYKGRTVGVASSKFGSPAVAMTVATLAHVGARNVIGVGYCGGLATRVGSGDIVVPIACVRDEGTTPHYAPLSLPACADPQVVRLIEKKLIEAGHPYHLGTVWTTDAVLQESSESVAEWANRQVLAVDMESAALLLVAQLLGVRAAALLVVSDHPGRGERAQDQAVSKAYQLAARTSLDVACELADLPDPVSP